MAAAAVAVVVVLLATGLVLVTRDGDGRGQTTATTSSTPEVSVPGSVSTTTDPASTSTDPSTSTTAGASTTTTNTTAPVGTGVLEPDLSTLILPKADATAGASRTSLTLRNTGSAAITYTTQSSSGGLSVAPQRGTIGPGGSSVLAVTLDASRIDGEGVFTGTLTLGGTGGARTVQVQSTVGRPPKIVDDAGESCTVPSASCNREIKLDPPAANDPTVCNSPWAYAVTITDQSQIQSASAIARRGIANADTPLVRVGTSDVYRSDTFAAIPGGGVLRFTLEAVDIYGFARRLPEQTVTCP